MFCVYGFPVNGRLVPVDAPVKAKKGQVIREETVFYETLTPETRQQVCRFLSSNLGVIANGDMLMYAAVDRHRLIVEVELLHDQIYTVLPRPNGTLNLYVVLA